MWYIVGLLVWDSSCLDFLQNGADVKWVDGGKTIFKVSTNVVSTVYTQVRPSSGCLQSPLALFLLWWTGYVSYCKYALWRMAYSMNNNKMDYNWWMAGFLFVKKSQNQEMHCKGISLKENVHPNKVIGFSSIIKMNGLCGTVNGHKLTIKLPVKTL